MNRWQLLDMLSECTGETIWPLDYCRQRGVPTAAIEAIARAYESGPRTTGEAIFLDDRWVNQFEGIADADLAVWIARQLGVDIAPILAVSPTRVSLVRAIRERVEEG